MTVSLTARHYWSWYKDSGAAQWMADQTSNADSGAWTPAATSGHLTPRNLCGAYNYQVTPPALPPLVPRREAAAQASAAAAT